MKSTCDTLFIQFPHLLLLYPQSCSFHRITEHFGWKGPFKGFLVQPSLQKWAVTSSPWSGVSEPCAGPHHPHGKTPFPTSSLNCPPSSQNHHPFSSACAVESQVKFLLTQLGQTEPFPRHFCPVLNIFQFVSVWKVQNQSQSSGYFTV